MENKLENTIVNKAKFFAQYCGQKVFKGKESTSLITMSPVYLKKSTLKYACLELKSLSLLTPQEQGFIASSKLTNDETLIIGDKIGNYFHGDLCITDYLRSRGYALPYMGLSIENLVNREWITLNKDAGWSSIPQSDNERINSMG